MILRDNPLETDAVFQALNLVVLSARTAPKSAGIDDIEIAIVTGDEKDRLAEKMLEVSEDKHMAFIKRDSGSINKSEAVVLIGVNNTKPFGLNCGACGYRTCEEMKKNVDESKTIDVSGPSCYFKLLDLGIAVGSAVKTASIHNLDNRIMYSAGMAARKLEYLSSGAIIAIPVSAKGKNPFFDRRE